MGVQAVTTNIIDRLTAEYALYDEGSHMRELCIDAAIELTDRDNTILALEKLIDGCDNSRKVMLVDNDNKTRLVSDHADALSRALAQLEDAVGMTELYKEDNDTLRSDNDTLKAALKAHGEEAAEGLSSDDFDSLRCLATDYIPAD